MDGHMVKLIIEKKFIDHQKESGKKKDMINLKIRKPLFTFILNK